MGFDEGLEWIKDPFLFDILRASFPQKSATGKEYSASEGF